MNHAPESQRGLALGAWGAVQASAAGVAIAVSGVIRDVVSGAAGEGTHFGIVGPATGYAAVYAIEIVMLCMTMAAMAPLIRGRRERPAGSAHAAGVPAVGGALEQR
jgi:BCD family chlorophyll transporter-like MFS transporter